MSETMGDNDLRALANAATPGPYEVIRYRHGAGRIHVDNNLIADLFSEADREYYAAASPAAILALLDELDRLRYLLADPDPAR